MKKILTAIGDECLNQELRNNIYNNVVTNDIDNEQALLEILKIEKIDFLFIHEDIIKSSTIEIFVEKVQEIQKNIYIIIFTDNILKIQIESRDNIEILDNKLNIDRIEKILNKDIEKYFEKDESKIISISGCSGVGKSVFSTFFAKNVENNRKKILLIDFDLDDYNIKNILRLKNKNICKDEIENNLIKYSENLDILSDLDVIYKKNEIDYFFIRKLFDNFRKKYDYIIVDTSAKLEDDYLKNIYYNSDKILFLVEPNIIGVKKANEMLDYIDRKWKYPKNKINLVINKANIYQIDMNIMTELFPKYEIVGRISYSDKYNLMLNRNVYRKEVNNEYKIVFKKLVF